MSNTSRKVVGATSSEVFLVVYRFAVDLLVRTVTRWNRWRQTARRRLRQQFDGAATAEDQTGTSRPALETIPGRHRGRSDRRRVRRALVDHEQGAEPR